MDADQIRADVATFTAVYRSGPVTDAEVLAGHCRALLAEVDRLTAERDAVFRHHNGSPLESVRHIPLPLFVETRYVRVVEFNERMGRVVAERDRLAAENAAHEQQANRLAGTVFRQRREVAALRAALQPFADFAATMDAPPGQNRPELGDMPRVDPYCPITRWLLDPQMRHCRDARNLLAQLAMDAPPAATTPPAVRAEVVPGAFNPPCVVFTTDASAEPEWGTTDERTVKWNAEQTEHLRRRLAARDANDTPADGHAPEKE
jgi:hypothetical protein